MSDCRRGMRFRFPRWEPLVGVAAVGVLVALIVALYRDGFLTLASDEMSKAMMAWYGLRDVHAWLDCIWLPGHHVLIGLAYEATGNLWLASRLVAPVFGVLAIVAVYRLERRWAGRRAAAMAAVLCATQPLVVWLSASGMTDMLYAGSFMLGLALYWEARWTGRVWRLYAGTGLLALACTCHYNAWILVAGFALTVMYDAVVSTPPGRRHHLTALAILAVPPVAWCVNCWLVRGDPLVFLGAHTSYSAAQWATWGYEANLVNAAMALVEEAARHVSMLALVGLGSVVFFAQRRGRRLLTELWLLIVYFGGVLLVLYATGGRPTAFSPRYLLVPALVLVVLAARVLGRWASSSSASVKALAVVVVLGLMPIHLSMIFGYKEPEPPIVEARTVAEALAPLLDADPAPCVVLEVKYWNYSAIRVFTGRPQLIWTDRHRHPLHEQRSVLARSWTTFRKWAGTRGIRYICAYSDEARAHLATWPVRPVVSVASYTVYELPEW